MESVSAILIPKINFKGKFELDDFYMVQSVWDENMAESIAVNRKEEKMVVLTGNGHVHFRVKTTRRQRRGQMNTEGAGILYIHQ